jgi:Protein of unknown function (DUF2950)
LNPENTKMKKTNWMMAAMVGAALAAAGPGALAQEPKAAAPKAAAATAASQKTFATPEEAVKALVEAVRAANVAGMLEVIGPKSKDWLFTGDKVSDAADWKNFLAMYDRKNAIKREGDAKAVLVAGDDWPFPAPLVLKDGKWSFDSDAGREEVTNRRVGRNELDTIQTMLAIVDAQREYAAKDADGNKLADYAIRFRSTPGKKDGLYWATKAGEPQSPLGPIIAQAVREGYAKAASSNKPAPYNGYYYRMLTSQGKEAPGGAYDYMVKGKLFGGFGVVAWPATYGNSGVKTFLVNHDGVVHEKDLGPGSAEAAGKMKSYNPDKTWSKVQ